MEILKGKKAERGVYAQDTLKIEPMHDIDGLKV